MVPLAVQWWASYYPGAEPGGGGYIAQRMFSAKTEKHAVGATLLFNIAHYALRPWPWILIALASLVVFPELTDIQSVFPNLSEDKLGHDVAYPAMLTLLPSGLLGLVAASLIAAFMSTISTQLNLGASYLVNDVYQRFMNPKADQKELVRMGQVFTILTAVLGLGLGLLLTDATQAFNLLLLLGAGTGLIYILRWFWWRINAYTEIVAMIASLLIAGYFTFFDDSLLAWQEIVIGALLTTVVWAVSVFLTPSTSEEKLMSFYSLIKPQGPGWKPIAERYALNNPDQALVENKLPIEILCVVIAAVAVYAALFATGNLIYGNYTLGFGLILVTLIGTIFIFQLWSSMNKKI